MKKALVVLVIATGCLAGCNKGSKPASSASSAAGGSGDAVQQKLQELAGNNAKDCGRLKTQAPDQMKTASECSMQSAQKKEPFYVAYDMPGLTVGVAGNSDGKLFAVHAQQPEQQAAQGQAPATGAGSAAQVQSEPCPAELRVAQSGRVTCFSAASFGMPSGQNPHGSGGMMMPPPGTQNPHGGMTMPPPGTANPHGDMPKNSTPPKSKSSSR